MIPNTLACMDFGGNTKPLLLSGSFCGFIET